MLSRTKYSSIMMLKCKGFVLTITTALKQTYLKCKKLTTILTAPRKKRSGKNHPLHTQYIYI